MQDIDRRTAADWAAREGHYEVSELLQEWTKTRWPEIQSARRAKAAQANTAEGRVSSNHQILYHATDEAAARAILSSQQMLRGGSGAAGGGIYFATSPCDAQRKARTSGTVLLTARVALGRSKVLAHIEPNVTFTTLHREGYDSVQLTTFNGDEYVVYNWDQVHAIERV